jgi:hypothetical protein
MKCSA